MAHIKNFFPFLEIKIFIKNLTYIPQEYWSLFITVIVIPTAGWPIPTIAGWYKARTQLKYLKECIDQIDKLDKNTIEDKIKGYYVDGKISKIIINF